MGVNIGTETNVMNHKKQIIYDVCPSSLSSIVMGRRPTNWLVNGIMQSHLFGMSKIGKRTWMRSIVLIIIELQKVVNKIDTNWWTNGTLISPNVHRSFWPHQLGILITCVVAFFYSPFVVHRAVWLSLSPLHADCLLFIEMLLLLLRMLRVCLNIHASMY